MSDFMEVGGKYLFLYEEISAEHWECIDIYQGWATLRRIGKDHNNKPRITSTVLEIHGADKYMRKLPKVNVIYLNPNSYNFYNIYNEKCMVQLTVENIVDSVCLEDKIRVELDQNGTIQKIFYERPKITS